MHVIRVTVGRRSEGIRVEVAMSPSVLDAVAENHGVFRFDATDEDVMLDLNLEDFANLDPEEPENEFQRMEFAREAEEYAPISDDE
jgi:hypothetical protein